MTAAALVLAVASAVIYLAGAWFRRAGRELDRHIVEALDVANDPRDFDGNVAGRWIG